MKTTMSTKTAERIKDRQDYRRSLINKREEIDRKIGAVEGQIKKLKDGESK